LNWDLEMPMFLARGAMTAFSMGADGCGVADFHRPMQLSRAGRHRRQGFVSPHGAIEDDSRPEFEPEN
jgi:hypothetical protein